MPTPARSSAASSSTTRSSASSSSIRTRCRRTRSSSCSRLGREVFAPYAHRPRVRAVWWPRFLEVVRWVIAQEQARRPGLVEVMAEVTGELELAAPGGPFVLTARADRLERHADGRITVIDYKTGQLPKGNDVLAGRQPQLPLEAAMVEAGGFAALGRGRGRRAAVLAPLRRRGGRRGAGRGPPDGAGRARRRGARRARASGRPLRPQRDRLSRPRAAADRAAARLRSPGAARRMAGVMRPARSSIAPARRPRPSSGGRPTPPARPGSPPPPAPARPSCSPIACCACCWPAPTRARSSA